MVTVQVSEEAPGLEAKTLCPVNSEAEIAPPLRHCPTPKPV